MGSRSLQDWQIDHLWRAPSNGVSYIKRHLDVDSFYRESERTIAAAHTHSSDGSIMFFFYIRPCLPVKEGHNIDEKFGRIPVDDQDKHVIDPGQGISLFLERMIPEGFVQALIKKLKELKGS